MLRIPLLTLALLAAHIACETPSEPPAEIPPCTPIDGATVDPCKPGAGTITVEGFLYLGASAVPALRPAGAAGPFLTPTRT